MKKIMNRFGIIAVIGLMLLVSYWLGTTQAETIIEVKTIEKTSIVIPDNYVCMDDITDFESSDYGLLLHFKDGTGYYWER